MGDIGYAAIVLTLIVGIYIPVVMLWGVRQRAGKMLESGRD